MPSESDPLEKILSGFPRGEFDDLVETRRDLHRNPELAFEETRTAGLIAGRLEGLGLPPRTGVGKTGVVADAGTGGPRLLLRADMDALPLTEESGEPFASEVTGRMHACGHDGALEDVRAAIGLHLWNQLPVGKVGVYRGAMMAAVDEFEIEVVGRGGHGAAPHETSDPIVAAARIVEALQGIVSREVSPLESAVVTVASIHGGEAFNIIPSTVRLTGAVRWFTEATGAAMPGKVGRIVSGTAAAAGVSAHLDYRRINRPVVNDPAVADAVIEVARRLLGEENVDTETRTLGGEDMSVYLDRVPGCFFFVGSAPAGPHRPHHSPSFAIDERALAVGVVLMEAAAREVAGLS